MSDTASPMDTVDGSSAEVDEKLYSRQLYVMGHEAQRRMMSSSVLLIGLSGLGVEIAKNITLAGISSLTLVDPFKPTSFDLGGNFYLKEEDLVTNEKTRAELCVTKLSELNPYVTVRVSDVPDLDSDDLTRLIVNKSCVVVTIPLALPLLHKLNAACRANGACFVYTLCSSVFSKTFCDFGDNFHVADTDGENPASAQIESIVASNPAVVRVLEDHGRHGLETGDFVRFDRVVGPVERLSQQAEYEIKVTGPFTFELVGQDFTSEPAATQGYILQVKKGVTVKFRSLEDCLSDEKEDDFMFSDFGKMDRPKTLHRGFLAMEKFLELNNELPSPGNEDQIQKMLAMAMEMGVEKNEANVRIIRHLASGAKSILSPMCAAVGGVVGQEVLKACSGKFMPIRQFLYFDADETLPDDILTPDQIAPQGSRHDSQIAIFGKDVQSKINDLNYFLVGAGAIGCEMLKNWALMGVGSSDKGNVYVTDMDRIEKSNLSRQFLFRNKDINSFKSTAAASAIKEINPDINITALQEKVAKETEGVFGDEFFSKLSGVCTALDNVEARLYVDQRCLFYRLPMLESGTLGTKGNTQIIIPHKTENYGATRDPPEKSIPVCTLKNFPNQIQHTLQWARDYFEGVFKQSAEDVNTYLSDPLTLKTQGENSHQKLETAQAILNTLVDDRPRSFQDCVTWARLLFEKLFDNQIRQLLHNFPSDQLTSTGNKFWSGSKRCPQPLTFDLHDKCQDAEMRNHFDFIVAASNLRAEMFGIKGRSDETYFQDILKSMIVPDFKPKEGVKIAANDQENEALKNAGGEDTDEKQFDTIVEKLPSPKKLAGFRLHPIDFDKDIDDHMLFVTACSNLRAMNYSIPTEDTHRSRAIAGRIIPAIATTTALVTGLVCLELYKIVGSAHKVLEIDSYKNGFVNLAIPFVTFSDPTPPAKTKCVLKGKEWNWTSWDSMDILDKGDITLGEFLSFFETEYNLEISMLSTGVSLLFSFFANKKTVELRKKMKMSEVVETVTKKDIPDGQLYIVLDIIATDATTDEDVELPYIKFKFR